MSEYTTDHSNLQQDTIINLNSSTFERCSHDREHPYVMINRDFTRNASISFEARGFLIYLLGHSEGWQIKRTHILATQNIGYAKLKTIIDELIKEGYILMERYTTSKGFRPVKYLVSEFPRFKENIPHIENPHVEIPHVENHRDKERTIEKKEQKKEPLPSNEGTPSFFPPPKRSRTHGTNPRALGTSPRQLRTNPRNVIYDRRREWAETHYPNGGTYNCNGGCGFAGHEEYVVISGSKEKTYSYKGSDPFWDKIDQTDIMNPKKLKE